MPTRTRVLGQRFTVALHKDLAFDHPEQGVVGCLGICDADAQHIAIDPDQSADRLRETYLHEHIHAMLSLAGMRDTLGSSREERVVKRLAPILLQFLRDNPAVYSFLTGRAAR
jgi:hypothetical protein